MSGSRQHFIPRFLQKGFASHTEGNEIYTWVFRKKGKPFNPNIKNIGLEGGFYTLKDDAIVDDIITEAESEYGRLIHRLRKVTGKITDPLVPELIAHLEIRTRHFRENFLHLSDILIKQLNNFIDDEELFIKFAKRQIKDENSFLFKDFVDLIVEESGYDRENAVFLVKMYSAELEKMMELLKPTIPKMTEKIRSELSREKIKNYIKSGHINVLKKTIAPQVKRDLYKKFEFRIIKIEDSNLIQGDSPVLFKIAGDNGSNFRTYIDKSVEVESIILPLTTDKLLLGGRRINIPSSLISESIARNSLEYFISANNDSEMYRYQKLIGQDAYLFTENEIEELAIKVFNGTIH